MQPVHAQETQHGNPGSHPASTTTAPSGTEHGAQNAAGNESHGAEASGVKNDGLKLESHDAKEGHGPAGSENNAEKHEPMNTEAHSGEAHSDGHGDAHTAAGGDHGAEGHHTGYHPPAPYVIDIGGTTVHINTLISTWIVMAILLGLAVAATRKLARKPGKAQVFFESLVDLPHYVVKSQITHNTARYVPLIGTIFLFILVSNWMGLFPWRIIEFFTPPGFELASPTNDLNTNGAIAITAVASYWFFGIKKKGLAHFKHYFQPMWFLFPLNMMEDVSRPLSLSFRLFGNILGGEIVIGILLFLTAPLVITSLVVLPMFTLEVLVGFIQAFIFSMLTASYIGGMVAEHH